MLPSTLAGFFWSWGPLGIVLHRIPLLAASTKEHWGLALDQQIRQQNCLSKADEAEQEAAKAMSPDRRDSWLKLAQGYRDLAAKLGSTGKL